MYTSDENDLRDAASSLHLLVSTFSHSGTDQTADWSLDSLFYMCVLPYYREEREVRSRKICWEFTRKKKSVVSIQNCYLMLYFMSLFTLGLC